MLVDYSSLLTHDEVQTGFYITLSELKEEKAGEHCVCGGRGDTGRNGWEGVNINYPSLVFDFMERQIGGKTPGFSSPPSEIPLHWRAEVTFMIYEKKTQADALSSPSLELSA